MDSDITSYDIETSRTIPQPTRDGYDFDGWLLSGDDTSTLSTDLTIPQGTTGDLEYIAQWTAHIYTISYDLHGGTVSQDNPTSYTIESEDILLTSPDKAAYDFVGWMLSSDSNWELSTDVTIPSGSSGDREYIAQWWGITYAISYDLQGGSVSEDNPVSYDIESVDITLANPAKTGYDFKGWTGTGLSAASINVTIPEGSSGDRSYTATWGEITYAIIYDLKGGSVASMNPANYDIESESIKLTNPTRTGYTFNGWSGTGITGTSRDVTIPAGSIGNRTYTANWTVITYDITYNLNGGSVTDNPDTYTVEDDITLNNPERLGYTFDGWTGTDLSSATQTATISQGSIEDRSYTANFTPITYTINYDLDGGVNNSGNPTSYTIEDDTIILQAPTREGYDFIGWTFDGETITAIPSGSIGSRTLTATWKESAPVISQDIYTLTASQGEQVSLTINASGVNLSWSIDGTLSDGLDFSTQANTASITGTPAPDASGTYDATVSATNDGGTASAQVSITIESEPTLSIDIEAGTPTTTYTDSGASTTSTQTLFTYNDGTVILSTTIDITTEIDNFLAQVDSEFSTTINVDVTLNLSDPKYNEYAYSLEIAGLPDWLNADGELDTTDTLEPGESEYHHEFTLSGTPIASSDVETITLTARVNVSGLEASGSKEFTITAEAQELVPEEVVLQSIDVVIHGDNELTLTQGTSGTLTLTANMSGLYSDGSTRPIDCSVTWDSDSNIEGVSFSDGTLNVNESAPAGSYDITITAAASSGDITASNVKIVRLIVNEIPEQPTEPKVPVLSCETPNVTLRRGSTLEDLAVTSDVVPDSWTHDGELPDGLSFTSSGGTFSISGTVEHTAETGEYVFTVRSVNEAGSSEPVTLTITITSGSSPEPEPAIDVPTKEIAEMADDEIQETLGQSKNIKLTGEVENIAEVIEKLETLTEVKHLDLSEVTGVEELTLDETTIESINLIGNTSIKNVEVKNAPALTSLNLAGSAVENVQLKETKVTELDLTDCASLDTLYCSSCDVERLIVDGCDNLINVDCSYNQLMMFNASGLANLRRLECRHQSTTKPLHQMMNFGSFMTSSVTLGNVKNLKAYDKSGNLLAVDTDDESEEVTFSASPAKITYDYDTGFADMLMDVTVFASEPDNVNDNTGGLGSSGGCDSGFGLCALAMLMFVFRKK